MQLIGEAESGFPFFIFKPDHPFGKNAKIEAGQGPKRFSGFRCYVIHTATSSSEWRSNLSARQRLSALSRNAANHYLCTAKIQQIFNHHKLIS